jgi:hypothetical protein
MNVELRHPHGSQLPNEGGDIVPVLKRLGHPSPKTTNGYLRTGHSGGVG